MSGTLEADFERLLFRLVPGLDTQWRGASGADIASLEVIAGRPLPAFYRWFLERMGESMGPLQFPSLDFSARSILRAYEEELVMPHPQLLLIGYESDDVSSLHVFYDLSSPNRLDARVVRRPARGGVLYPHFETFREMLGWTKMLSFELAKLGQQCAGAFLDEGAKVYEQLAPVMARLGFSEPIETGPFCALYERADGAMICCSSPDEEMQPIQSFILAGADSACLRRILGVIATETSLQIHVDTWEPKLP